MSLRWAPHWSLLILFPFTCWYHLSHELKISSASSSNQECVSLWEYAALLYDKLQKNPFEIPLKMNRVVLYNYMRRKDRKWYAGRSLGVLKQCKYYTISVVTSCKQSLSFKLRKRMWTLNFMRQFHSQSGLTGIICDIYSFKH